MTSLTTTPLAAPALPAVSADRTTRTLLAGGVIAGPLFVTVVLAQALTRDGFDPRRHPLSLLGLGDLGWIQIADFVLAGLLFLGAAVGLRRALHPGRGGTWGPLLVGVIGLSMVWAGVFVADPYQGYPVGVPEQATWHGALHNIAPALSGLAQGAACLVMARRYAGLKRRGWAAYCVITMVAGLVLNHAAMAVGDFRLMLAGGVIAWLWVSVVIADVLTGLRPAARH
ncbi:Protein of unknown function [Thermomonospora echinospora]|uniref:DUF998 domain-containing protein n=1 Tax=Thermomonospora echinospora TaxID=1992 RepID=A0A1H6CWW6_9ACTN|nr:DUF998 domain-containing protein [Thermomonospora echinospora]SEG76906.1 Protein of unknown function [Thermomonospora echinospora]